MLRTLVELTGTRKKNIIDIPMSLLFSGGNKRKLNTAVALVGGPSIVLLVSTTYLVILSRVNMEVYRH